MGQCFLFGGGLGRNSGDCGELNYVARLLTEVCFISSVVI